MVTVWDILLTLLFSKHRNLSDALGLHTYICWASENNAWNVTAYFNPEVYHPNRV